MAKLLGIYFTALALFTFVPTKVSSFPFINLAQSIQFEIDPDSPVISVEKDLLVTKDVREVPLKFTSLNEVVGKQIAEKRVVAAVQTVQQQPTPRAVLDYSKTVRADGLAQMTISGPIELKQGLALTDEHRIEIHRESKGSVVEYGEVDIQKGTYAIKLSNIDGHICARLRGSQYEIIGEGCFSLDRVKGLNKSTNQGPMLSVSRYKDVLAFSDNYKEPETPKYALNELPKKTDDGAPQPQLRRERGSRPSAQAGIIDFYDSDNPEAKELALKVQTSVGNTEDSGSTVVATLWAPNHPAVRTVANAGTTSRGAPLPNNKATDALRKWAEDAGVVPPGTRGGTVWGRTMSEGRAVAGAQVEIEGRDDLKPLYLNEFYIPDINQKATASHGLYTFVGVSDGEYSIRATQNNKFMGFQNISVREDALALGDIDSTERKRPVRIAVYDLINKTSQSAVATLQNLEEDVVVEGGQADVAVQDNFDTAYAMVNPLDKRYMTAQYMLNPGEDLYNFPLVSSSWVESILSQAKLERPVRNKVVLGIGSQKPFRVEAIGSRTAQVIYFDSQGQVLDGKFGSAGGGFIILDPEDEVNEYAIQAAGEKSVRAVYMPTVPNVINVIQL